MNNSSDHDNPSIHEIVEEVEKRTSERETRRFRLLYVLVGLVSFIGVGVLTQLVDFYATKAVEQRLENAKKEYESAKVFAQLLSLATKLDVSDSFSNTDREAIMRLLGTAKDNKQLRSEPAFDALFEKIIDSFSASDNASYVSKIYDDFTVECLRIPGVVQTLIQHYGRQLAGLEDIHSDSAKREIRRFEEIYAVSNDMKLQGAGAFMSSLLKFRLADSKQSTDLRKLLSSYRELPSEQAKQFARFMKQFADPMRLAKRKTPTNVRIAELTQSFVKTYADELAPILQRATESSKSEDD